MSIFASRNPETIIRFLNQVKYPLILIIAISIAIYISYRKDFVLNFMDDIDIRILSAGEIDYNIPNNIFVEESLWINAAVSYIHSEDFMYGEPGRTFIKDTLIVGKVMSLQLIDYSLQNKEVFKIENISDTEQVVDLTGRVKNHWTWKVTPMESGDFQLAFKSGNWINSNTGVKKLDNPILPISIKVQSRSFYEIKRFVKLYWVFIVSFIIIFSWLTFYITAKNKLRKLKIVSIDDFMNFESKIRTYIRLGDVEKAFKIFNSFLEENGLDIFISNLDLFQSNFYENKSNFNLNIISLDDYNLNRSKIVKGIFDLINEMKDKHTTQLPL